MEESLALFSPKQQTLRALLYAPRSLCCQHNIASEVNHLILQVFKEKESIRWNAVSHFQHWEFRVESLCQCTSKVYSFWKDFTSGYDIKNYRKQFMGSLVKFLNQQFHISLIHSKLDLNDHWWLCEVIIKNKWKCSRTNSNLMLSSPLANSHETSACSALDSCIQRHRLASNE